MTTNTFLAYERTRVSYERTLQAWIRTGMSLITFGFSVYNFFRLESPPGKQAQTLGPREFGVALVSLGLISLVLATINFRFQIGSLRARYPAPGGPSLSVAVAAALSLLGVLALVLMFART